MYAQTVAGMTLSYRSTSFEGQVLGLALRAAAADDDASSSLSERSAAWASLQRLRHLLESEIGPPGTSHKHRELPPDLTCRVLELVSPYGHGARTLNHNVDADAIRVVALLFHFGGVGALANNNVALLQSYAAIFCARALARPKACEDSSTKTKQWRTSDYICDLCSLAVAIMAVQVVRVQKSDGSLQKLIAPLGKMLHETMAKVSAIKDSVQSKMDVVSIVGKVQATYTRVLHPKQWSKQTGGSGRWAVFVVPVLMAAIVWHQGGWSAVAASDNGILTAIGVIMLLCSALPWVLPALADRELHMYQRAAKVSGTLVEMAVFLRATGSSEDSWGEYVFADGGVNEKSARDFQSGEQKTEQSQYIDNGHNSEGLVEVGQGGEEPHSEDENEVSPEAILESVRGLGDLAVQSLGQGRQINQESSTTKDGLVEKGPDGNLKVKVPFPSALLDRMVALERMLREQDGDPAEIEKAAERVRMMKTLMGSQNE